MMTRITSSSLLAMALLAGALLPGAAFAAGEVAPAQEAPSDRAHSPEVAAGDVRAAAEAARAKSESPPDRGARAVEDDTKVDAGDGIDAIETHAIFGWGDDEDEASEADDEAAQGDDAEHAEGEESETDDAVKDWQTQRGPMPYEVIRSLQFLQDQVAQGNDAAIRVQARLLKWFGPSMLRQPKETWTDGRNLRAAALFVMSGGPPSILRELLEGGAFDDKDKPLIEGALAYTENRLEEAMAKLSALDLKREETVFAAQVNLALAQLSQEQDPAGALARLEQVMLDAPGTLLDEAALRMGVMLADQIGQTTKADHYARQYFDRYARSAYAGNFRARFTAVYSNRLPDGSGQTIAQLDDAVRMLDEAQRLGLYLSVARRSLVAGNLELTASAAERALGISAAKPEDRQRALLYSLAATLSDHSEAEVIATLAAIDDDLLHPADKALKDAVAGVEQAIREPVGTPDAALAETLPPADNAVLARASSLLKAVEGDLESLRP